MNLTNGDLLQAAGLRPKRTWGQNFCQSNDVLESMVEAADLQPGETVLELGAGLGALTAFLVQQPVQVIAIERDRDLIPVLRQRFANGSEQRCTVVEQDASQVDYAAYGQQAAAPLKVVGNLPYHLASRLMVHMAQAWPHIGKGVFMVQREVAQRAIAQAGSRDYGLLSLLLQRFCDVTWVRDVGPHCFYPPPKVHSAIVALRPHGQHPLPALDSQLVRLMRTLFGQRRKQIHNSLAKCCTGTAEQRLACLAQAELTSSMRPEQLSLHDFARLTAQVAAMGLFPPLQGQIDEAIELSAT